MSQAPAANEKSEKDAPDADWPKTLPQAARVLHGEGEWRTVFYCGPEHARADAREGLDEHVFPVRLSAPAPSVYCGHCGAFLSTTR